MDIKNYLSKECSKRKRVCIGLGIGAVSMLALAFSVSSIKEVGEKMESVKEARDNLEQDIDTRISSNYVLEDDMPTDDTVGVVANKSKKLKEKKREDNVEEKTSTDKKNIKGEDKGSNDENSKRKSDSKIKVRKFNEEKGLAWPVKGEIIKEYSVDKLVYYPTLKVFKSNPAIFIGGDVGMDIKAAADGIVKKVSKDIELGQYVEIEVGSGYIVTCGQLDDVKVSEGDSVIREQVIAKIAEPSSYYKEEGSHLYFQVKENDNEVNPLMFLE